MEVEDRSKVTYEGGWEVEEIFGGADVRYTNRCLGSLRASSNRECVGLLELGSRRE
jgi:hypothetical protein